MTDLSALPPLAAPPTRADLVGNLWTFGEIAAALGCTERSIYNLVDQFRIPYVRVVGKRLVNPSDVRAALAKQQHNAPARGRGRPRNAA